MASGESIIAKAREALDLQTYRDQNWTGSFSEYLELVKRNPMTTRSAFERIYDMILAAGTREYVDNKKKIIHYNFFDDPERDGADAIYGLDIPMMRLLNIFKSAAQRYGTERRVILLHGPVGSSKSTIARLLKQGLESYSRKQEGALFTFGWIRDLDNPDEITPCPMHEEPLHLVQSTLRPLMVEQLNDDRPEDGYHVRIEGELCPFCRQEFRELSERYGGDWAQVVRHIQVRRLLLSAQDRVGIGTFQPKDEKNQDSTELTGDINYRKIAEYGSDSDPRAFNFDGEFNIANRGMIEFIEVLKLDVAFLYELLGASQEHQIKPKKFPQTFIDEVIVGHTNEPEYRRLQNNEYMEALRDRTVKVDVPYITKLDEEIKIYQKDYNQGKIRGTHIAPHSISMAAMWAVLTRLEEPKKHNLTLMQKLKLYNGKSLPGFTEENVKELRKETVREGMDGISPRYVQDKISNALVSDLNERCVNPFMIINELESGLKHHSLITSEETRQRYRELLDEVRREYEDVVKNEVQRAIAADEAAISRLCSNYVDNVKAYTQKERVRNVYTGQDEEPDERLMRSIEEKIDIPEARKDDFRREIMNYIGALALEGKKFDYRTNERLHKALELKLFEDQKDSIKLTSLVSSVMDKDTQEKIDIVKGRLVRDYNYCDSCASDVLHFVASIFARGDVKER
ncbi:MAG: serine protein kinase [bacterium]|nr:serine protein kinase [bacterium]